MNKAVILSTLLLATQAFSATVYCSYSDQATGAHGIFSVAFGPEGEPPPGIEANFTNPMFKERIRWDTAQMRREDLPEIGAEGWRIYTVGVQPSEFPIRSMSLQVPFVGTEPSGMERLGKVKLDLRSGQTLSGPVTCRAN